ncbi:MAG: B12-binding domain-containing radical SAM protein [Planctomycetota bacterium]|jgi:haloalkane dehalogenase
MSKLLLTSICKPIGPRYGDSPSVGYELLHGQVTTAQGLFSPRAVHRQYGLEFIAANLDTPTTVLNYPSQRQLIRVLRKGYEFIGISFVLSTYHRMKELVALIRKHSPQSKIILGGYGTVIEDELLQPYGDFICREEGVGFMRKLLGEPPRLGPFRHPVVVSTLRVFSVPVTKTGLVFAGLGCPSGCDFCCTSHFFRRRHIRLLEGGREILGTIEKYQDIEEGMKITILDEDFLLNKKRALEFAEAVRVSGRTLSIFCFASVRALSQYTIEELVRMGIDGLWIGVEGRRSGYLKQSGTDVASLFAELRSAGIIILASMIIGFDYQTPEIIREELDYLLAQKPTLAQFLIYGPTPGTPFYDRVVSEGRLRPDLARDRQRYFKQCTGFDAMVTHPTLSSEELRRQQRLCFKRDFECLGPSIVRSLECALNGYQRWRHHADSQLRRKAMVFRQDFVKGLPVLPVAALLGPSAVARQSARQLLRRGLREVSPPWVRTAARTVLAFPAALWTALSLKLHLLQHPFLRRTSYPGDSLRAVCGQLVSGRTFSRLEICLESLSGHDLQTSLPMLSFKGTLDHSTLRKAVKRLKKSALHNLGDLVVDLRNLEAANHESFMKLIKVINTRKQRLSVFVSEYRMDRLRDRARELKHNIDFFVSEESFLAKAPS